MGKNLASFFRGEPRPFQPHSCCTTAGTLMTLCQKFVSSRRVQSKRAVLQEVMLIDSYSCSCPVLVMRLCQCCEPANGFCVILCLFVCVRVAFAFVNTSEKANAWAIGYYVLYLFTEINCFTCFDTA